MQEPILFEPADDAVKGRAWDHASRGARGQRVTRRSGEGAQQRPTMGAI